jgi:plastocyanin
MRTLSSVTVMVLLLAACAGDPVTTTTTVQDTATTTVPAPGETTTEATTTTVPSSEADHQMVISGFAFSGPDTVRVGDTILVINDDTFPHTWTSEDGGWSSGTLTTGQTFVHTFEAAGTFDFLCTIHPEMTGTITVEG